jgi:hypothetical protein
MGHFHRDMPCKQRRKVWFDFLLRDVAIFVMFFSNPGIYLIWHANIHGTNRENNLM